MSDTWMELRRLALAATPGPWKREEGSTSYPECDDRDFWAAVLSPLGREIITLHERYSAKTDDRRDYDFDAAYIAAANPAQVLALLDALDRLTSDNKRMEELVEAAADLTFSAYPAHGSGFVCTVRGDLERLHVALAALTSKEGEDE